MASQQEKEKFFADLDALGDLAGEDEETPPAAQHGYGGCAPQDCRGGNDGNNRRARGVASCLDPVERHSQSKASLPGKDIPRKRDLDHEDSVQQSTFPPRLVSSKTAPEAAVKPLSKTSESTSCLRRTQTAESTAATSKRAKKKGSEVPQIFKGQVFFFVPNDNRAVSRKRRIDKAIAHGATWARAWTSSITHVIVESNKKMQDVIKLTGKQEIPENISLVCDNWLTESLGFKEMRDTKARRFQFKKEQLTTSARPPMSAQSGTERHTRSLSKQDQTIAGSVQNRPRDDLDDLYEEAKATQHLPLDLDGNETPVSSFVEIQSNTSEEDLGINKGFSCMLPHNGREEATNPNAATMAILQEMSTLYDRMGDSWRTLSYRKAIAALRKQKTKIETKEQARAIPQIGERLADKIEEIVSTKQLRRLESAKYDPNEQAMQLFMGIYGVGVSVASKWIAQGHRTLSDIRTKVDLTENQRIGLDHYEDFNSRIPRAEVAEHGRIVQDALHDFDPALQVIIGGSYRRGKPDCGDIDCLITKKDAGIEYIRSSLMESVVPSLFKAGFLKASLAMSHSRDDGSKWHGASALPNSKVWRRIDLLFVPWDELGAALIYFTGNDIFNRSIRLLASKKDMRLNQRGLYKDVMRGEQRARLTDGTLVEGQSEQKIMAILGVPWRRPEDRQCG